MSSVTMHTGAEISFTAMIGHEKAIGKIPIEVGTIIGIQMILILRSFQGTEVRQVSTLELPTMIINCITVMLAGEIQRWIG